MYPHERSLVRQLADYPFAIVGVNSDRDREKIKAKIAEENISWRSFWNGTEGTRGPISTKWNVSSWPTTFLIDAEGIIRHRRLRGDRLNEAIETLLAELGHEVTIKEPNEVDEAPALAGQESPEDAEESQPESTEDLATDRAADPA